MTENGLSPHAFQTVKSNLEEYVGIESVERTEYDDIILVNITGPAYRPANYNPTLERFGLELTHIDISAKQLEYTKTE